MVWVITLSFVFAECAFVLGLFLPGDSLLFTAGVALAAHGHEVNAWLLSAVAVVVAVGGNLTGYFVGRTTGVRLLARRGGRVLNRENLAKAQEFLDRRGFWAIVLARWIPWVRTLAPMIAGAARMDVRRYLLATTVGGLAWVPTLVLLGYYGADLLTSIPYLEPIALTLSVAFFVVGTGYGLLRYRSEMHRPVDDGEPVSSRD
jgi:membrane-associated protein